MRAWLIAAMALAVAGPVQAADQFDLLCHGQKRSDEMRYRLDLDRGEYCFGECAQVMKISEVTAGLITLYDDEPKFAGDSRKYNTINRSTGAWHWFNYSPRLGAVAMDVNGQCEPAPFSGFPQSKF